MAERQLEMLFISDRKLNLMGVHWILEESQSGQLPLVQ
jgi:hypothetical protein